MFELFQYVKYLLKYDNLNMCINSFDNYKVVHILYPINLRLYPQFGMTNLIFSEYSLMHL